MVHAAILNLYRSFEISVCFDSETLTPSVRKVEKNSRNRWLMDLLAMQMH